MKYKSVSTIAAILCGGFLSFIPAFAQENTDGKTEQDKTSQMQPQYTLEELKNAEITATGATNADNNGSSGTSLNNDQMEELTESLFRAIRFWSSLDDMSYEKARLSTYDRVELWRKEHKLEKDDMTNIFAKTIQDFFLDLEKKTENKKLKTWHSYALSYINYYPLPQKEFMELIQKTFQLEPESVKKIIFGYISAYPDWVFDDKPIIEIIYKTDSKTNRLFRVCADLIDQIRKEKNVVRKKKLLDKAYEWAFQDDKLDIFCYLDRILLDHYDKDYATNPERKLQLEKDLKRYEEAQNYDWVYRRTKYALEHFGEGDEAFEMLYKMDTDPKLQDGEWDRSERKRRSRDHIEEMKKAGKDPRSVYSKRYLDELYNDE